MKGHKMGDVNGGRVQSRIEEGIVSLAAVKNRDLLSGFVQELKYFLWSCVFNYDTNVFLFSNQC